MKALLIAAFVSSGILIVAGWWQRRRERKALLLAFTTELVEAFCRTVKYYMQSHLIQDREFGIGFSALYEATDANMLGKLASVVDEPDVIHAIIRLKERNFQIQRHVLLASDHAAEHSIKKAEYEALLGAEGYEKKRLTVKNERDEAELRAIHALSRALAFFAFDAMADWTNTVVNYTRKRVRGRVIEDLNRKLRERIDEKWEAEANKAKPKGIESKPS